MKEMWFWAALMSATLFVPSVLAIPFFKKNFGYSSDAFVAWYFLGSTIFLFVMPFVKARLSAEGVTMGTVAETMAFSRYAASAMCFGLVFNALANSLLFYAYSSAPNPALPEAVVDSKGVMVFLAALALANMFPKYFDSETFNWKSCLGIILVTVGVILVAFRKTQETH